MKRLPESQTLFFQPNLISFESNKLSDEAKKNELKPETEAIHFDRFCGEEIFQQGQRFKIEKLHWNPAIRKHYHRAT